ncbi:MAG: radical SAM protein, partial [Candidatus Zixiibacteriota bacterium]
MKFYIHKLGCPKNDVDADYIAARLIRDGHEPVFDPQQADSIVVNTCGFILSAKEESIHELLRLGLLKKSGRLKTLYASGCLSQRHGNELLGGIPELDGAFGLGELEAVAEAVTRQQKLTTAVFTEADRQSYLDWTERFVDDNLPFAYLKISDGCDRRCAYCAIPDIRGPYRSRPVASVVAEANSLAASGKKELILVSQDVTMYGHNYRGDGQPGITDLLGALEEVDGVEWIRLLYLHPAGVSDRLIDYVSASRKTLDYYDVPLQHINNELLTAMNRR